MVSAFIDASPLRPHSVMNVETRPPPSMKIACSNCNLREVCLPVGMPKVDLDKVDGLVAHRRKMQRGERLYCTADPFEALYAVRLGFLKSSISASDGREQVTGFH